MSALWFRVPVWFTTKPVQKATREQAWLDLLRRWHVGEHPALRTLMRDWDWSGDRVTKAVNEAWIWAGEAGAYRPSAPLPVNRTKSDAGRTDIGQQPDNSRTPGLPAKADNPEPIGRASDSDRTAVGQAPDAPRAGGSVETDPRLEIGDPEKHTEACAPPVGGTLDQAEVLVVEWLALVERDRNPSKGEIKFAGDLIAAYGKSGAYEAVSAATDALRKSRKLAETFSFNGLSMVLRRLPSPTVEDSSLAEESSDDPGRETVSAEIPRPEPPHETVNDPQITIEAESSTSRSDWNEAPEKVNAPPALVDAISTEVSSVAPAEQPPEPGLWEGMLARAEAIPEPKSVPVSTQVCFKVRRGFIVDRLKALVAGAVPTPGEAAELTRRIEEVRPSVPKVDEKPATRPASSTHLRLVSASEPLEDPTEDDGAEVVPFVAGAQAEARALLALVEAVPEPGAKPGQPRKLLEARLLARSEVVERLEALSAGAPAWPGEMARRRGQVEDLQAGREIRKVERPATFEVGQQRDGGVRQ